MREPCVWKGSSAGWPSTAKMSLFLTPVIPQTQPLTIPTCFHVQQYTFLPFKNTVKLWAYKNNSEHIYTSSHCFFFFNTKKVFVACKVWCFTCFWGIHVIAKKWNWKKVCKLIITMEGRKGYAHIHIKKIIKFKKQKTKQASALRETLAGRVSSQWKQIHFHEHMMTHKHSKCLLGKERNVSVLMLLKL